MAAVELDDQPQRSAPRPEVRVRRATPEDAAPVAVIHVASWRAGYAGLLPEALLASLSVEVRTTAWTGYLDESAPGKTFIATGGDTAYGFATVGPGRDADPSPGTGELWALYVHPEAWGLGVGASLLESGVGELRVLGFSRATLWVLTANRRARRFYESHGWRPDGASRVDRRDDVRLDEVRYERVDLT